MTALEKHVRDLHACQRCPLMHRPAVSGPAVRGKVLLVGQAPGVKEPVLGRPFAWTAGKTMFRWFAEHCGVGEANFRRTVYMAAVCRCFPGKSASGGGDRVPTPAEIAECGGWLEAELRLLRPQLVIPVGKLAIAQFLPPGFFKPAPARGAATALKPLTEIIGQRFRGERAGVAFDIVPLPHPSGASPWHRMEPGRTLLHRALGKIAQHPAWQSVQAATNALPPVGQARLL